MSVEHVVTMVFFVVLIFYALGRRQGFREGFVHGVNFGPLELRRQALEKGYCPICGYGQEVPCLHEGNSGNEEGDRC